MESMLYNINLPEVPIPLQLSPLVSGLTDYE